jgi:DNA-binding beta-propeller fold protein YncE
MNSLRLSLLASLALFLGGCVTVLEKPVFLLGSDASAEAKRMMWPTANSGEIPRYLFLGDLTGENNFVAAESVGNKASKSMLKAFFDILIGEDPPLLLDRPQTGTVDEDGRIFVTDTGRSSVFVFDEKVGKLHNWEKADGLQDFISPVGIAAGPKGHIYVADAELGFVAHLDPAGTPLAPIGKGELERPTGLAFEPKSGRLFVTDTKAHQIKVFDLEGKLLDSYGEFGEGRLQFNYPTHIAVRHEKLYVSDTLNARVQVLSTATGRFLGTVGNRGLFVGNLVRPKGIAADSEHNIYVIESFHDHMLIYNRRGEFLMPLGGLGAGPGNFHLPSGIWIDARNRVFVADMMNGRVSVFQFLGGDLDNEDR